MNYDDSDNDVFMTDGDKEFVEGLHGKAIE